MWIDAWLWRGTARGGLLFFLLRKVSVPLTAEQQVEISTDAVGTRMVKVQDFCQTKGGQLWVWLGMADGRHVGLSRSKPPGAIYWTVPFSPVRLLSAVEHKKSLAESEPRAILSRTLFARVVSRRLPGRPHAGHEGKRPLFLFAPPPRAVGICR